jgi:hypothetical protein
MWPPRSGAGGNARRGLVDLARRGLVSLGAPNNPKLERLLDEERGER